jgi:DivIVA domain-containing protein
MKKKDTTSEDASGWGSSPAERITPLDVQQKEFRVARFGAGYRMREVDEFLDQVTDVLSSLTAENERLREGAGAARPAPNPTSSQPSILPTADEGGRAAVDAFIRREKGFLQDLGGLVQAHAEELRSMVRAARRDAVSPQVEEPPAEEPRDEPAPARADVSEPEPDATAEMQSEQPDSAPEGDSSEPEVEAVAEPATESADDDPKASPEPPTTGPGDEEPIRLEDPQPARSRRSDDDQDGSLRELFWGEE